MIDKIFGVYKVLDEDKETSRLILGTKPKESLNVRIKEIKKKLNTV